METGFNVYITEISTANISSLKLLHKYRIMKQILLCFVLLNSLIPAVKSQSVVYYLDEEKPENTYIGNVAENSNLKAYVLNPSDLVSVNYRFLTENNPAVDYFHLNERDSSLYTSKKLDREELCEFKTVCQFALEVIARCQPSGSCYNKVTVTVVLRDINDNFPVFPKKNLNISFSEGSFTGTAVPINYAVDKDQGNYSVQNYAIEQLFPVPVSQEDQQFSIQVHQIGDISSVNIVLMKQLDREIQNNYKIRVYASDGGSPPKNGSMDVDISVTDINDNAPVFAQRTYNISVNEDIAFNTTILSVFATDPDEGLNGKVLYRLSPNQDVHIHNLFDINENTGDIKVIGSLKYEPGESYQIIVWARDQAIQPLISQAHVYVYIKDVHNNPPQINVNLLSNTDFAEILENASLNAAVAHIKVNDPDNGSNGIVNCTVNNANFKLQRFDVHEYKVVVAKNLNRESIDQHSITVTCSDSGTPSLNASAHFLVHVLDVNDNAPIFSQEVYTREIAENNDIGISILKVSATDFDSGKNAEVRYSLRTTSHGFAIDASSGVVTLNRALDRENSSKIEFEVVASDGGTPRKSSVTKVIIRINDINDNAPVFSEKEYVFSIYENLVPKSFIGFVGANDSDSGENGKVLITIKHQKNVDIPFQILDNGSLVSLISMDREVTDRYDFTLVAMDKGQPPMRSSVHVTVFVLDVNDNTPVFVYPNKKNKTVEISYQTPPNTIISMLSTRDADEGQNSKVTYFMADNKMSDMFQLNSISGRIRLAKHLTLADVSTYTLGFTAQDKGSPPMSSDQTLTIIISKTQLDGSVMDDLPVSHREYFLIAVAITCVTIVLAVVIVIAIFLIRRADRLKYTKSSQNNNANKPVESKKKCQDVVYNLTEESPDNTYLGNVAINSNLQSRLANPADFNSITYSFIKSEHVSKFRINETSSTLYTSTVIDRDTLCEFKSDCVIILEVIAKCKSSSCYEKLVVKINVIDVNDNYPTFPKQKVDLQFSEGALLGTSVPISAAVDMDSGIFSIQRYTTEQLVPRTSPNSHPYFVIKLKDFGDSTIVSIVLNRTLDREIQDHFLIRVLAFDGGVPPKIGSMELNITVADVNDNAPEFSQTTYTVSVNENIGINSTIISVSAHDPDQRLNGHVLYRLSPNQDDRIHSLFAINETTGDIRVIGSLMNGQIETYEITVWANDKAAQPLMSQTKVFVHVKDVVNSPPVIDVNLLSQTTVAEISEAAGLDAAVAHIKVSDPDKGPNGQLTCSVISDKFKLQRFDQDDREFKVVVAKPLNRETAEQHTVTVFCIDGGSPSQNASAEFIVHVLDENDNSPIFSKDTYEVNFAENNKIGASVLKVTARDFDSGKNAKVTYELDPTDRKYFAINPVSGVISASAVLDRENASLLSFPVYCKDGGSPSNTATTSVIVHVTDVNDNAPVFTESNYVFSIPENFARTVKIGILSAKDNDKGINGVVSFSLKSGKNVPFTVSPNGTVQSTRTLDREEVAKHQFEVIATDGGNPPLTSVSMVTVFVLDENDNRPEFKFPNSQNNTVVMSYQTPPNTIVTTIKTEDKDDALNSKVTYFLRSDDEVSGMFQLNSLSGRLILLKHLSVADAKKYTFSIIAQDKGTPPKVNERTLSVVITTQKLDGKVTANLQDHHREYFLIAVAIACVTVVLAVVIVIAIFLVRRADRLKKMCNNNGSHGDKTDPKKKVSFSTKNAIITTKPQKDGSGCQQQQFQTTLYDGQSLYQVRMI
ncbi:hypothetical protein KUTeg_025008 [Tegillarca granosa]|uniref:Cadherin domain-containing protein n=1 Tax=Tegillarca granosa TaxID=220873 RepID=A0ABQ9DZN2_TEGGR|nr:hypothetical protein KUTeg_025008 [Tegillarca granosa]